MGFWLELYLSVWISILFLFLSAPWDLQGLSSPGIEPGAHGSESVEF